MSDEQDEASPRWESGISESGKDRQPGGRLGLIPPSRPPRPVLPATRIAQVMVCQGKVPCHRVRRASCPRLPIAARWGRHGGQWHQPSTLAHSRRAWGVAQGAGGLSLLASWWHWPVPKASLSAIVTSVPGARLWALMVAASGLALSPSGPQARSWPCPGKVSGGLRGEPRTVGPAPVSLSLRGPGASELKSQLY